MPLGNAIEYIPGLKTGPYATRPLGLYGVLTVGRDGHGHDVKFFGDTTGRYSLWDASVDSQILTDSVKLVFGTGSDVSINWDGTNLVMASVAVASAWNIGAAGYVINTTQHGTVTVGVDDTGYDVKFFGATAGCSMLWDESADQLIVTGNATTPALKLAGAGSLSPAAYAAVGAAWADAGTPAFIADQMYAIIDIAGTLYRLPLWANA